MSSVAVAVTSISPGADMLVVDNDNPVILGEVLSVPPLFSTLNC